MINEEVTRQVIEVKKRAIHLTAREVVKLMKMILSKVEKEKDSLKDFISKQKPTTVKDLVKKGKIETLELNYVDLKNLKRDLNKNGVKFSIKKILLREIILSFFRQKMKR